ncbi:hypothetical protein E1267_10195 [Nonomuraea longispora]|uniref:Uncharacterized protein n=2 Tax=Nonomuraea TaxID=83681 RepID=A0A4R4NL79_9ACTN|nr:MULTISPECIES: hypothetical protein [Nonomuraea]TDC08490.1 hypothetical protein E1267_10195 [Nonomuraea longispora]TDE44098.1 hypothetical protein E1295_25500 [Nonomuraea mesophila]
MTWSSRYASRRVYLVPADLTELTGPITGVVELPTRLDWSEQRFYDMLDNSHVGLMYERVIREATRLDELRMYLNYEKLIELWPRLFLPIEARRAWEASFQQLRRAA